MPNDLRLVVAGAILIGLISVGIAIHGRQLVAYRKAATYCAVRHTELVVVVSGGQLSTWYCRQDTLLSPAAPE